MNRNWCIFVTKNNLLNQDNKRKKEQNCVIAVVVIEFPFCFDILFHFQTNDVYSNSVMH